MGGRVRERAGTVSFQRVLKQTKATRCPALGRPLSILFDFIALRRELLSR
jgi:hypothetical protein